MNQTQKRISEGCCPDCGEISYPYYYCNEHRRERNIKRALKDLKDRGALDVAIEQESGDKLYKWKEGYELKERKYSKKSIDKMRMPRINGKPMTSEVVAESALKVLEINGHPLTKKEMLNGIKQLKILGKVIPRTEDLIREYKLIKMKASNLPKSQRDGVEFKINFMLSRGTINESQLIQE